MQSEGHLFVNMFIVEQFCEGLLCLSWNTMAHFQRMSISTVWNKLGDAEMHFLHKLPVYFIEEDQVR